MGQPILALTPIHNDISLVRNALRRCLSNRLKAEDFTFLELFSRILIGRKNCPGSSSNSSIWHYLTSTKMKSQEH
ncbi:putative E3 ubiquitin-protein ligase plr-1 [Fusarium oxysporum f. sp. albedinis]|nr:putative E3 ubiquitin-protein ligase plr-1 [Fusarium oxysporum f. sp. albedinis]